MKVSQLIYTACGKDRTGAFSVFSLSNDITPAEENEIVRYMSYRKGDDVPYEPTEEEIKKLCPKKFGYFLLSTGRYCIAKTTYISTVYSDLDARLGNFFIHAFVFKDLEDINPFDIFSSSLFKEKLTYKEWHDDPIPDSLPQIEYKNENKITDSMLKNYFLTHKEGFKKLVDCVLTVEEEPTIIIDEKEENLPILYHLLSLFIPNNKYKDLTFINQHVIADDYAVRMEGLNLIKLRTPFQSSYTGMVDFDQERNQGNFVFDFIKNDFSEVKGSEYVDEIAEFYEKAQSSAEFVQILKDIEALKNKSGEDLSTSIALYHFMKKHFNLFEDVNEYNKYLRLALKNGLITPQQGYLDAYNFGFKSNKWVFDKSNSELLKEIYKNLPEMEKKVVINKFLQYIDRFVSPSLEDYQYVLTFRNEIFDYIDYLKVTVSLPFTPTNDFKKLYFLLANTYYAASKKLGDETLLRQKIYKVFETVMLECDLNKIKRLLDLTRKDAGEAFIGAWIYNNVFKRLIPVNNPSEKALRFAFELLEVVPEAQKEEYLLCVVKNCYISPLFFNVYTSRKGAEIIKLEEKNEDWVYQNLYLPKIPKQANVPMRNLENAFDVIDLISSENLKYRYLVELVKSVYTNNAFVEVYLAKRRSNSRLYEQFENKEADWIYNNVCIGKIPTPDKNKEELENAFRVKEIIKDERKQVEYLVKYFDVCHKSMVYLEKYVVHSESDAEKRLFQKVDAEISKHPDYKDFVVRKGAYSFNKLDKLSDKDLKKFFEEFYSKNLDGSGMYAKRLEEYINSISEEARRFLYCLDVFADLTSINVETSDLYQIISMLEKKIYSIDLKTIDRLVDAKKIPLLEQINNILRQKNKSTTGKYEILSLVWVLNNRRKDALEDAVKSEELYKGLSDYQIAEFYKEYNNLLLDRYGDLRKRNQTYNAKQLLKVFYQQLFDRLPKFQNDLLKDLLFSKNHWRNTLLVDMIQYGLTEADNFGSQLKLFVDKMVDDKSGYKEGDIKNLLALALKQEEGADRKESINIYLQNYKDDHKRFLFWRIKAKKKPVVEEANTKGEDKK